MTSSVYCIILAGGTGSRLWPLSRPARPKQFLDLVGVGRSMLQLTYERFRAICPPERFIVVTLDDYVSFVREQLPDVPPGNILCEPFKRNTAAAIAYAGAFLKQTAPDAVMVVTPSDHLVLDNGVFVSSVAAAVDYVESNDVLMTIGIKAFRPETSYGYIQVGDIIIDGDNPIRQVKTFTEKPDAEMANTFFEVGDFYWNSGVFVWRRPTIEQSMRAHMPTVQMGFDVLDLMPSVRWAGGPLRDVYERIETISIDYAVMEKASNVAVCLTRAAWSDVGAWGSVYEQTGKDARGNAVVNGNAYMKDAEGCLVHADRSELVVVDGLKDYLVVERDGVTLICPRSHGASAWRYASEIKAAMEN